MKFENEIIDMYTSGYSYIKIIQELNCSKTHIYNVLNKNNIELRNDFGSKRGSHFSIDDISNMYKLYEKGMSAKDIALQYNTTDTTIRRLFHQNGYQCRSNSEIKRKYSIDENYFDSIDTQEKAYILGLLYADGSNELSRNKITIGLQKQDMELLEKVKNCISSNKPLYCVPQKYDGAQPIYKMELCSEHMCSALKEKGMVPNKSLILEFPKCIPNNLIRHFIRGYFDGDGYISKPSKPGCQIEIMGTLMFCDSLKTILLCNGIDCYIKNTNKPDTITRYVVIGKQKECKNFCEYIYKDATIYMQRKYNKAFEKFDDTFGLCTNNECA